MRKKLIFGVFLVIVVTFSPNAKAQWEPAVFAGHGYMTDVSGYGNYTYLQGGMAKKVKSHRTGLFLSTVYVDVDFNNYRYRATEGGIGFSYDTWKKVSENFTISFWFNPAVKYFADHGENYSNSEEAFQQDIGANIVTGINLNDKLNRWFRSYKFQTQYQQPFWSARQGTWAGDNGYLSDKVNFKAVNKVYLKSQFEVIVKKITTSKQLQIEPKLVAGYQLNGVGEIMYETGAGFGFSFMKGDRYYEVGSFQYRVRTGQHVQEPLTLFELGINFINTWTLIF
ncbi:MAG: hypothetical protein PHE20_01840 [Patescibacteria group bacterium]|nr:hypothetical protein [Patescibacteria group bacterium]